MYQLKLNCDLSPNEILDRVSQEQIFEIIFTTGVRIGDTYKSPFRHDTEGKCYFKWYQGKLLFKDYADPNRNSRSCFIAIQDYFKVDFNTAKAMICSHYNITHTSSRIPHVIMEDTEDLVPHKKVLSFIPKEFEKIDIRYWSQFLITTEQLKEDGTFCCEHFSIDGKFYPCYTPTYVFTFPDYKDNFKFYRPFLTENRFYTNCDANVIGNLHNVVKGKKLVITKSYKDCRVLRNLGVTNTIWFQNEGMIPSDEIVFNLLQDFPEIVIFFDNDEPGLIASKKVKEHFNNIYPSSISTINIPLDLPYKDSGEFIKKEGSKDTINLFQHLGLYGN